MSEIDEFQEFHPRAVKLMRKHKDFIVVACDEPYYMEAYALIRQNEIAKGTWTDVDESCFTRAAQQRDEAVGGTSSDKSENPDEPKLLRLGKCPRCEQDIYHFEKYCTNCGVELLGASV